jgi:hypothetical protein
VSQRPGITDPSHDYHLHGCRVTDQCSSDASKDALQLHERGDNMRRSSLCFQDSPPLRDPCQWSDIQYDRRRLRRSLLDASPEWSADLTSGSSTQTCPVLDLHSFGACLWAPSYSGVHRVDRLVLRLGRRTVSEHTNVRICWHKDGALGLNFETTDLTPQDTPEPWDLVKPHFLPYVSATDPANAEICLAFRMVALAGAELLLDSSPCNRHLLQGLALRPAQCYVPIVGSIAVDLELTGIGFIDGRLRLRAKMLAVNRNVRRQLDQFRAFACAEAGDKQSIHRCDTIAQVRRARVCGPGLRVDPITSSKEYRAVLELRRRAYLASGIISPETRAEEMADRMDRHSLVLVARVNDVILGTGRLIFCREPNHQFLFEKDIPFSAIGNLKRSDCVEVSRFAIEPELQDSDVMSAIVRGFARHAILTDKAGICLARTSQRSSYAKYGFVPTSLEVPHPRLAGQTLALMVWRADYFLAAAFARSEFQKRIIADVRQSAAYANLLRACPEQLGLASAPLRECSLFSSSST